MANIPPGSATTTINAISALNAAGIHWFDDNALAWQELVPPVGSQVSAWDTLGIYLVPPQGPNVTPTKPAGGLWYADVTGKMELNIDKKQTPGTNAPVLTIINMAADEVNTTLYFFTPIDLLNFYNLIPTQVLAVTRNDLLSASGVTPSTQNASNNQIQTVKGKALPSSPTQVPICTLVHPAITISGRSNFVLKTMGFVVPPREGKPPQVSLTWIPLQDYNISQTIRSVGGSGAITSSAQPASKATGTPTQATPPQTSPKPQ